MQKYCQKHGPFLASSPLTICPTCDRDGQRTPPVPEESGTRGYEPPAYLPDVLGGIDVYSPPAFELVAQDPSPDFAGFGGSGSFDGGGAAGSF